MGRHVLRAPELYSAGSLTQKIMPLAFKFFPRFPASGATGGNNEDHSEDRSDDPDDGDGGSGGRAETASAEADRVSAGERARSVRGSGSGFGLGEQDVCRDWHPPGLAQW